MSLLYIRVFNDSGATKYGLFYENGKGIEEPLIEDFKQVGFESEVEAKAKLVAMEAERESEDSAVAFSKEEAKMFVESHKWKFATTYAKTAPHEYLVKKWLNEEDRLLFERLVQTINTQSDI